MITMAALRKLLAMPAVPRTPNLVEVHHTRRARVACEHSVIGIYRL